MPFKKKRKVIHEEYVVNALKTLQSDNDAKNLICCDIRSEKLMRTNQEKDTHSDKVLDKKVQNSASTENSMKKLSGSDDGKRTSASKKSSSKHGTTDFKVKHTYASGFNNHSQTRNKGIIKANTKSLPSSNLPVKGTSENSPNSVTENNVRIRPGCQEINFSRNQSHNSHFKSESNFSNGYGINLEKHSAQSHSVQKRPSSATVVSRCQDERLEFKQKNKEVTSTWEQHCFRKRPSEPVAGPSAQKGILNVVLKHIKADKKFQANVKSLMAKGNITANKNLIYEEEEYGSEDEEMDWEPCDQIHMIEHIKSIRKNLDTATSLSCDFALQENNFFERIKQNVLIVLDTNVFISCLSFIRDLRDSYLPELGLPLILIPWVVLRELDHLKSASSCQLAKSAVRAIRYINESFSLNHPRVLGQSFEDYSSLKNAACNSNDDEILSTCINVKAVDDRRRVILITNDRNLESKAMVSKVEAYTKQKFLEYLVNTTEYFGHCQNDQKEAVVKYSLYPKLNGIMKIALEKVLEIEFKKSYGETWLNVVKCKPPWNLANVFDCFLKHWRSVFTFTFKRNVESQVQDVRKKFASGEYEKGEKFATLIKLSAELLVSVRHDVSIRVVTPEMAKLVKLLTTAIQEMEILRKEERTLRQESLDVQMSASSIPIETEDVPIIEPPVSEHQLIINNQRKEEVKALFQIIWNQVQSFCMRVNEVVSNIGNADPTIVNQIKFQFPQVIQKLQELIEIIAKIVSMEPQEIAQSGQLIRDFTNFLISLNVIQTNPLNAGTLLSNIEFFFCDEEGREILRVLINDLKQFGALIVQGMNLLGVMYIY